MQHYFEDYKFNKRVYYVQSQQDDTVKLAVDPIIRGGDLIWFDTTKERIKPIKTVIVANADEFSFESSDSAIYSFLPLTIDLYEKYVKSHLIAPQPYKDEVDLINQIIKTIDFAW